jgi:triosephosphate isomerase
MLYTETEVERLAKLKTPLILVNFKTYTEGMGKRAVDLAKKAERVGFETGVCIGLAPQYTDITDLAKTVSLPIFAQHMDHANPGGFTGHILPEALKEAGIVGTLVNHSERRLKLADIEAVTTRAGQLGLATVICTNNANVSVSAAALKPDCIAIEPPELIGTGIPVSKAKPEIVADTVKLVRKINRDVTILCGAGITKGDDVAAALRLGTKGVLVASGIVKAKDPYSALLDFAKAVVL